MEKPPTEKSEEGCEEAEDGEDCGGEGGGGNSAGAGGTGFQVTREEEGGCGAAEERGEERGGVREREWEGCHFLVMMMMVVVVVVVVVKWSPLVTAPSLSMGYGPG